MSTRIGDGRPLRAYELDTGEERMLAYYVQRPTYTMGMSLSGGGDTTVIGAPTVHQLMVELPGAGAKLRVRRCTSCVYPSSLLRGVTTADGTLTGTFPDTMTVLSVEAMEASGAGEVMTARSHGRKEDAPGHCVRRNTAV